MPACARILLYSSVDVPLLYLLYISYITLLSTYLLSYILTTFSLSLIICGSQELIRSQATYSCVLIYSLQDTKARNPTL